MTDLSRKERLYLKPQFLRVKMIVTRINLKLLAITKVEMNEVEEEKEEFRQDLRGLVDHSLDQGVDRNQEVDLNQAQEANQGQEVDQGLLVSTILICFIKYFTVFGLNIF